MSLHHCGSRERVTPVAYNRLIFSLDRLKSQDDSTMQGQMERKSPSMSTEFAVEKHDEFGKGS